VGHARTRIAAVADERGEPLERIEIEQSVALARFGQQLRQTLRLVSWERPTGELVRFESQVSSGGEWTLARGQVRGEKLEIESATPGKTERLTLPWTDHVGGFHAAERLLKKPWKPGERRVTQALVPLLNQIGKTELQDAGVEALRIEGQSRSLRKIRRIDAVGAIKLESTHWIDEQGETVRSVSTFPPPGMETVRTDRVTALAEAASESPFDLGAATRIPVANMPSDPHSRAEIVYLAELSSGSIEGVFPVGTSQLVRKLDERRAEVRVRAIRPVGPQKSSTAPELPMAADPPTEDDRLANGLVQADDPAVVALAKSVAADETDSWRVAIALESLVRRHVQPRQFSQAMASAAEVARSGEGDCTEHAVLLAAVCRARGLATRVAIGLVYADSLGGFAYHMWNEVWVDGQWIPLDATLARQGIGAGHLKLASSSLRGADAFAALLPVVNVLGRLKLSVAQP
jgi:transglutaminase-like putative cysteine protease